MNSKKLLTILFGALFTTGIAWPAPRLINYQGRLTVSGVPVTNPSQQIFFRFFSQQFGGNIIGGFFEGQTVNVDGGNFSVLIGAGSANGIPDSVLDEAGDNLWLEVLATVSGTSIIFPRQRLVSVPYAFRTMKADKADNGVPTEGIIIWLGASCPAGFTEVQGLRNRVPIGADMAGVDPDVPNGVNVQGGAKTHSHSVSVSADAPIGSQKFSDPLIREGGGPGFAAPVNHGHNINTSGSTSSNTHFPPFLTVIFCQKN